MDQNKIIINSKIMVLIKEKIGIKIYNNINNHKKKFLLLKGLQYNKLEMIKLLVHKIKISKVDKRIKFRGKII
jgi:hypothetical protein